MHSVGNRHVSTHAAAAVHDENDIGLSSHLQKSDVGFVVLQHVTVGHHGVVAVDPDEQEDVVVDEVFKVGSGTQQIDHIRSVDLNGCRNIHGVTGIQHADGVGGAGVENHVPTEFEVGRKSNLVLNG